ncbi:MAG: hypothetical protein H6Q84_2085 [Deltaproteobacteria bacterium]|nr:hypothetical protein [Deltaproteobacteria bacterium]
MRIDPIVFRAKFPKRCSLEQCKSRCCRGGVWADVEEREIILRNADLFIPYLRPEAKDPSSWFGETAEDRDCPSGMAVETNVSGDYCVFFHPDHGCSLQKAAADLGRHEWEFKPRFCIMFPLVVSEGVLTVDEDMDEVWCMQRENRTDPILSAVEKEVSHLFPEEVSRRLLTEVYRRETPPAILSGYRPKKAAMP